MGNNLVEKHPFTPFLPEGCNVIICGTFPPKPNKWAMDFFYPNYQNDMWRIFGLIFYNDKEHFFDKKSKKIDKEGIQAMLTQYRVGIGETVTEAIRLKDNASDKFLEIVKPVDLSELLSKVPHCGYVVTTGEKAASVISNLTDTQIPKMGERIECSVIMGDGCERIFYHWRLPSTSRAYPMPFEKKVLFYSEMLRATGILK